MTVTHTVRLDAELDRRLQSEARRRKTTIAGLLREMVKALPPAETKPTTRLTRRNGRTVAVSDRPITDEQVKRLLEEFP